MLGRRGDTIVEVMIVLAVLGFAIGISYATVNNSLMSARQAQENSQASALLQSQVEILHYLAPNGNGPSVPLNKNVFQTGQYYCLYSSGGSYLVSSGFSGPIINATGDINTAVFPAQCVNGLYYLAYQYGGAVSDDTFTLTALWADVAGQGTDSVNYVYRTHPL